MTRTSFAVAVMAVLGAVGWAMVARRPVAPSVASGARGPGLEIFMGCVKRTDEPQVFTLAVNVVEERDPLRVDTYQLVGTGGLALANEVGHTIEVTGALEPSGAVFPRLHVSSARLVAAVCTHW